MDRQGKALNRLCTHQLEARHLRYPKTSSQLISSSMWRCPVLDNVDACFCFFSPFVLSLVFIGADAVVGQILWIKQSMTIDQGSYSQETCWLHCSPNRNTNPRNFASKWNKIKMLRTKLGHIDRTSFCIEIVEVKQSPSQSVWRHYNEVRGREVEWSGLGNRTVSKELRASLRMFTRSFRAPLIPGFAHVPLLTCMVMMTKMALAWKNNSQGHFY